MQPNFLFCSLGKVCSVSSLHYRLWRLRVMNFWCRRSGITKTKALPMAFLFQQSCPPFSTWAEKEAEQVSSLGCKGAHGPLWSSSMRCYQRRSWRFQKQRGLEWPCQTLGIHGPCLVDFTFWPPVLLWFTEPAWWIWRTVGKSSFCFLSLGLIDLLVAAAARSNFHPIVCPEW